MIKPEVTFLVGSGVRVRMVNRNWWYLDDLNTCRLYYVHDGEARFFCGEKRVLLQPRNIYFIPSNLPFRVETDEEEPFVHTFFDFYMRPALIEDSIPEFRIQQYPMLERLMDTAAELMTLDPSLCFTGSEYTPVIACLNAMLALIAYDRQLTYACDPVIVEALDIIHARFRENIRVSELSQLLGYTEDAFIRKFRSIMKTTPYAYIKSLKLHEAKYLQSTGCRTAEIAQTLGYSDSSALCHLLKKNS